MRRDLRNKIDRRHWRGEPWPKNLIVKVHDAVRALSRSRSTVHSSPFFLSLESGFRWGRLLKRGGDGHHDSVPLRSVKKVLVMDVD